MKKIKIEVNNKFIPRNKMVEIMYQNLKSGPHIVSKKKNRQKYKLELKNSSFND